MPLRLKTALANSDEDIDRNIEYSFTQPYIPFTELLKSQSGAVSVVGSGPSLKRNWKKLRDSGHDIVACNAACQFLLERDIVPKYMFCFDADPLTYEFFTPHPDITYLLASRVATKAWEILKGCKIVCWHSAGDKNVLDLVEKSGRMEPMITGGTAAVTRAMHVVQNMGYSEIHQWGADASFAGGETHIRQSTTVEKRMLVHMNRRTFETAPWMAQQIEDFKILVPLLTQFCGITVVVHGDGYLPHLARAMTKPGCAEYTSIPRGKLRVEDGEPWLRQFVRELKWNISYLMQTI